MAVVAHCFHPNGEEVIGPNDKEKVHPANSSAQLGPRGEATYIFDSSRTPMACLMVILKSSVEVGALRWGTSSVNSARRVKKCHREREGVMQTFKVLLNLVIKVDLRHCGPEL